MGYYDKNDQWVEGELPLPEKTADGTKNYNEFIEEAETVENLLNSEEKNFSKQMDEIIKNNDKFETINVLISVLCRELGIQVTNQPGVIGKAIKKVYDDYYKSMEDWKNLTKQGLKHDIRQ